MIKDILKIYMKMNLMYNILIKNFQIKNSIKYCLLY